MNADGSDPQAEDEPTDATPEDVTPGGGRRLVALGRPPYDDPDPEAMDRFVEDMVAQIRASGLPSPEAEAADGADGTDDSDPDEPTPG